MTTNDKMLELKPCPFCGGEDIRYSLKVKGHRPTQYHAVMYCNSCHCYGKRTRTDKVRHDDYKGRREIQDDEDYKATAIAAWNTRADIADARVERLVEALRSIADNSCCGLCQEAKLVARKALAQHEGEGE